MRTLWKSTPKENCNQQNLLPFTFLKSIIARCSKKLRSNYSTVQKTDCILLRYENDELSETTLYDYQHLKSSRIKLSEDHCPHNNIIEEERCYCNNSIAVNKKNDRKSICRISRSAEYPLKEENNSRSNVCNNKIYRSKKNASIQTSNKCKFRNKISKRSDENDQKENVGYISTNVSSSKDIETIFTAKHVDFNNETSKMNLEFFDTEYVKEMAARKQKSKKHDKKSKKHDAKHSSRDRTRVSTKESVSYFGDRVKVSVENGRKKSVKNKNTETTELKTIYRKFNKSKNKSTMLTEDENYEFQRASLTDKSKFITHNDIRFLDDKGYLEGKENIVINSKKCSTNTSWESQNYQVEDKTSELMILGNVKKRLEEDYDDYFSLNDVDLENDFFIDSVDPVTEGLQLEKRMVSYRVLINHFSPDVQDDPEDSSFTLIRGSSRKQQEKKQDLINQSIRTNLTCTSSICFSNSHLSQAQSSYHTSFKDQECSPTSSMEYCTARNDSLPKLHSSCSNSFNTLFRNYSMDTSERRECFSNDEKSKMDLEYFDTRYTREMAKRKQNKNSNYFEDEEEMFQDSRDLETLVNSYRVCCYQRNSKAKFSNSPESVIRSTSKFSNSSKFVDKSTSRCLNSAKLITKSLDSGILTDCSRNHFCVTPDERFYGKGEEEDEKCCLRKMDLLPTYDFNTDSSYSDDSLNRRVDVAVKKFTENLILSERRARSKLKRMENPVRSRQERKRRKNSRQVCVKIINTAVRIEEANVI
ncbi:hypothetical protein WH47_02393 [Habropoda laboriosa]|uniref:Uncharacterized protein n=1 Tax=Habropoda laboriosa TaxID=597456 RepID=A0A0L7QZU1_9HYME|nr:hypothetical protein WH47_02393 [Habropoda laboriosa]